MTYSKSDFMSFMGNNLILITLLVTLFWTGVSLLNPSFLLPINNEYIVLNKPNISFKKGKMTSVVFNEYGYKYISNCAYLMNFNDRSLCDYPGFHNEAVKIEGYIIVSSNFSSKKLANTIIIKKIHMLKKDGSIDMWVLNQKSLERWHNDIVINQYIPRFLCLISYVFIAAIFLYLKIFTRASLKV